MKKILFCLVPMLCGCAHDQVVRVTPGTFKSERIERELKFYVATHPAHATNHFYVGATRCDHGYLLEALVYWKEERTLLQYAELAADAQHDIFAWQGHELKLDKDTVDTTEEIAGSNYLVTHRQWAEWVDECITTGKLYRVLESDARSMFSSKR